MSFCHTHAKTHRHNLMPDAVPCSHAPPFCLPRGSPCGSPNPSTHTSHPIYVRYIRISGYLRPRLRLRLRLMHIIHHISILFLWASCCWSSHRLPLASCLSDSSRSRCSITVILTLYLCMHLHCSWSLLHHDPHSAFPPVPSTRPLIPLLSSRFVWFRLVTLRMNTHSCSYKSVYSRTAIRSKRYPTMIIDIDIHKATCSSEIALLLLLLYLSLIDPVIE
jgi:hypothetical protein